MLAFDVLVEYDDKEIPKDIFNKGIINDEEKNEETAVCRINGKNIKKVYEAYNKNFLTLLTEFNLAEGKIRLIVYIQLRNEIIPTRDATLDMVMKAINSYLFVINGNLPNRFSIISVPVIGATAIPKYLQEEVEVDRLIDEVTCYHSFRNRSERPKAGVSDGSTNIENTNMLHIDLMDNLKKELILISKNKYKTFHGHPVHYIVPIEYNREMVALLLNSMVTHKRIVSRSIIFLDSIPSYENAEILFKLAIGGALVISLPSIEKDGNDSTVSRNSNTTPRSNIRRLLELSKEYSTSVLTIFAVRSVDDKDAIAGLALDINMLYVSLLPNNVHTENATKYLIKKAKSEGFKTYKGKILENSIYSPFELDAIYLDWKNSHLQNTLGYKVNTKIDKISYEPAAKLNNMVGLANVKEVVNQIISYFKMQKVYLDKGIATSIPCRHMVFYGNPGTAKTTIAKLLGTILKGEGLLPSGKFIETGRNGLVGQHVGHTALKTVDKIKSAKGGILFVDEAYSLTDDRSGSFGDEAINTLVQEMDKVRDDTIIILAGYPDKMEKFLDTNPGIRSRIGFHVKFDNYTVDELMQILDSLSKKEKFSLSQDAKDLARGQIQSAIQTKDFGNGRFVRTLLEQAMMKQATRLAKDNNYMDISIKELTRIEPEDISTMNKSMNKKKVGFNAN